MSPYSRARVTHTVSLLVAISSFVTPLAAQLPTGYQHVWSTRLVPDSNATALDVSADGQGNAVAVGTLGNDIYMAKYSASNGARIWSRRFSKSGNLQNVRVAVGPSGDIALALSLDGTIDFGAGLPEGTGGGYDFIVAKFDATGIVKWSRRLGGTGSEQVFGIGLNNAEDVWIAGGFIGRFSVGPLNIISIGGIDSVLVRFSGSDGVPQWAGRFGAAVDDMALGIAVDGGGNAIAVASASNGGSFYVVKYASSGTQLWANNYNTPSGATASGVAVDQAGEVVVVGSFSGQLDMNDRHLTSAGQSDIFLARFSFGGTLQYASRYGGSGSDATNKIRLDRNGDVVLTGGFSGSTNFGGGTLTSAGSQDIFVAKIAGRDGAHIFSRRFGGSNDDSGVGIAIDGANNLLLSGTFSGLLDFGNATLNTFGADGFVAKFTQASIPVISDNGVVNNASFAPGATPLAPGSIAAVFGSNLTDGSTVLNSGFGPDGKLLTSLGGASVRINDLPAPIFYSTPGQLGIQIPFELAGQTSASVQATVNGIQSAPRTIFLDAFVPGVFTVNQNGSGAAAVLHGLDSAPVTEQNPASPGEVVVLFCTGLGILTPALTTGTPSSGNRTFLTPTVTIDGIPAEVQFSGAAPGFIGLYQVNLRIPTGARSTSTALLVLSGNGRQSNPTTIAIGQ